MDLIKKAEGPLSNTQKRKRAINWLEEDRELLQELIKRDVSRIENKNTDSNTNKEKQNPWSEVKESFNQICVGAPRSMDQLKTQWSAIKVQARKTISERRKAVKATGGGPPPTDTGLSVSDISVWLPNEFVTDSNKYDSDAVQVEFLDEEAQFYVETSYDGEAVDIERAQKEISEVSTEDVKQPDSKKKKKSRVCPVKNDDLKNIAEVETSCRLQLHKLQMKRERLQIEKEKLIMANEEKRSKILDVELELLRAKLRKEIGTTSEGSIDYNEKQY